MTGEFITLYRNESTVGSVVFATPRLQSKQQVNFNIQQNLGALSTTRMRCKCRMQNNTTDERNHFVDQMIGLFDTFAVALHCKTPYRLIQ